MQPLSISVVGAGITGLWQALLLARRGHRVRLIERSATPFAEAASAYAGAMLAPCCEAETGGAVIRDLGRKGLALWRETYPGVVANGTLVVAAARDRGEIERFARLTEGYQHIDRDRIGELEPDLDGRFGDGLFYDQEAHVIPGAAMRFLLAEGQRAGVRVELGASANDETAGGAWMIDCRGLAARHELPLLRGVRGERLVVRTREITLRRPARLLHPRHPLYVVPWQDGLYMIGATVIESEDEGPITVRSALELLGTAYALHPAFGEAQIVETGAGVRPAFPDNVPKIIVRGRRIYVNGVYRHGFLLAPTLAAQVADYLEAGVADERTFIHEAA